MFALLNNSLTFVLNGGREKQIITILSRIEITTYIYSFTNWLSNLKTCIYLKIP